MASGSHSHSHSHKAALADSKGVVGGWGTTRPKLIHALRGGAGARPEKAQSKTLPIFKVSSLQLLSSPNEKLFPIVHSTIITWACESLTLSKFTVYPTSPAAWSGPSFYLSIYRLAHLKLPAIPTTAHLPSAKSTSCLNVTSPSIAELSSRRRTHSSPRSFVVAVRSSRLRSARRSARRTWPSAVALALVQTVLARLSVLPLTATMRTLPASLRYVYDGIPCEALLLPAASRPLPYPKVSILRSSIILSFPPHLYPAACCGCCWADWGRIRQQTSLQTKC